MSKLASLAKDTAIYGLSSIIGRFINYLLVPLYTAKLSAASGGYGVITNMYAYTALILVLLTFGMETTYFRFANDKTRTARHGLLHRAYQCGHAHRWPFLAVGLRLHHAHQRCSGLRRPSRLPADDGRHRGHRCLPGHALRLPAIPETPLKFAALKLLYIIMNIPLNIVYFVFLGKTTVVYVFFINLSARPSSRLLFVPTAHGHPWKFDGDLLRQMLGYSWPILVLGIAGILNQVADKIIFPLVYPDEAEANVQLGIYGACVKIAMIMAMITQAFRYAYEPIVFAKNKDADKTEYYARP